MSWKNGLELRNNEAPRLGKEEGMVLPLSVPWESQGGMDGGKCDDPSPLGHLPHCPKGREKKRLVPFVSYLGVKKRNSTEEITDRQCGPYRLFISFYIPLISL